MLARKRTMRTVKCFRLLTMMRRPQLWRLRTTTRPCHRIQLRSKPMVLACGPQLQLWMKFSADLSLGSWSSSMSLKALVLIFARLPALWTGSSPAAATLVRWGAFWRPCILQGTQGFLKPFRWAVFAVVGGWQRWSWQSWMRRLLATTRTCQRLVTHNLEVCFFSCFLVIFFAVIPWFLLVCSWRWSSCASALPSSSNTWRRPSVGAWRLSSQTWRNWPRGQPMISFRTGMFKCQVFLSCHWKRKHIPACCCWIAAVVLKARVRVICFFWGRRGRAGLLMPVA